MSTVLIFLLFAAGLVCIIWGGDRFVDAATWIAAVSGIPNFIVGATVVSLATTLPEVIVSVMAAAAGRLDMASGNAIGSVTANTALILALSIIFMPTVIDRRRYLRKSLIFLGAIVLLWCLSWSGRLTIAGCCAMLLLFAYFIYENVSEAKKELGANAEKTKSADKTPASVVRNLLSFVLGAAAIIIGSRLLVDNGTLIARDILRVDERIISLTLVAIGTSLPELVTAASAVIKRQGSLAAGNVIGANIIDMLLILPLCAFVRGGALTMEWSTVWIDLPMSFLAAVIILAPALITGRFRRIQGAAALGAYVLYLTLLIVQG